MGRTEAPSLTVELEPFSDSGSFVVAKGVIDLYSAPTFKQVVHDAIDAGMAELVVDLTDVEFLDSTGLGVLVGANKRLREAQGVLSIVTPDPTIQRVFEIVGLSDRFAIYDTRPQARRSAQ